MIRPNPGHPLHPLQSMMYGQQVAQWRTQLERERERSVAPQAKPPTSLSERIRYMNDLHRRAWG